MRQRFIGVVANEEMNVIWHDHVSAKPNSAFFSGSTEFDEAQKNPRIRQKSFSVMSIRRHEVQRRIVLLKWLQPRGNFRHAPIMRL